MQLAQGLSLLRELLGRDRLPHALLLLGEENAQRAFARDAAALLLGEDIETSADGSWEEAPQSGEDEKLGAEELRDRIHASLQLRPVGKRRVLVLLGIERLSFEARDALLKPLEEPPPATVILIGAPDANAVSQTIRSRCRILRLSEPASAAIPDDAAIASIARRLDAANERVTPAAFFEELFGAKRGDLSSRREKARAFLALWIALQRECWRSNVGHRSEEAQRRAEAGLAALGDLRRQVTPELALSGLLFSLAGAENFARY